MSMRGLAGLVLIPFALSLPTCGGDAADTSAGEASEMSTVDAGPLMTPGSSAWQEEAPATYRARFETSEGDFVIEVTREWAPRGADRFYGLVKNGYYDDVRFFRVIDGFMAQFGIHGDPRIAAIWRGQPIFDDPVVQSNTRGYVSYAMGGRDTRTTQVFINFVDNSRLDDMGFAPFGVVVEGMDVVDALHSGYGEGAPSGQGPEQRRIQTEGNEYLDEEFPDLDRVIRATIES